jgi:hypothetical protein
MQSNYKNLPAQELRKMFLNNTLDVSLMGENEYGKLFDYETELDESNSDILVFCSNGLNQYDRYCIDVPKSSFEEFIKKQEQKRRLYLKNIAFKVSRQVAVFAVGIFLVAWLAQGVAMAFGFDLFGFIRNWFIDNDAVIITTSEINDDITVDLPISDNETAAEEELVFIDYERIEYIDEVWLSRVSSHIINEFTFLISTYFRYLGEERFEIHFLNESGNPLSLVIQHQPMHYSERDDGGFVEEVTVNGLVFTVFTNMGDYKVVWEHEGYLYELSTFLPLETVEEIIRNYYE